MSGPLLFLGDLHAGFPLVNAQVAAAESQLGRAVAAVIVLGDFGIYAAELARYFGEDRQQFDRPLYFIEGNHEDFSRFAELTAAYAAQFTHLPRATLQTVAGRRLLCLGGANYMNAQFTPRQAEIRDEDIDRCLALPAAGVELIVSHDCPRGLAVASAPGFECFGPPGFPRGPELTVRFRPAFWLFGHHHQWFEAMVDGTAYFGLADAADGYGILVADRFYLVRNQVKLPRRSWLQRLCRRFTRRLAVPSPGPMA